jgi:Cu2+-containing amine oxidase
MKMNTVVQQSSVAILLASAVACGGVGGDGVTAQPIDQTGVPGKSVAEHAASGERRAAAPGSPLDPLSADEINQVMRVLRGEHRISNVALVPQI